MVRSYRNEQEGEGVGLMPHPELDGMNGGNKQMWLRQHQSEIVDYWWEHGTAATLCEFRISIIHTIERLLDRAGVTLWEGWEWYAGGEVPKSPDKSLVTIGKQKNRLIHYLPDWELIERQEPYGLGGQAKHKWLHFHRDEVIEYYRGHDFQATCVKYHCATATLGHLLGMPHDKKGRLKWKSAIHIPSDHIERKVDLLRARVMEETECRRDILKRDTKLRQDTYVFNLMAFHAIAMALDKAFPERDINGLIQQELHKLPSLAQPTPAIGIQELDQVLCEQDRYDGFIPSGTQCLRCAGSMLPDKYEEADICTACGNRSYWDKSPAQIEVKVG